MFAIFSEYLVQVIIHYIVINHIVCEGISNYLKLLKNIPNPLEYPT